MRSYRMLVLLALTGAVWAADVTAISKQTGIVIDAGDTGQFVLFGPFLSYKKEGDPKGGDVKHKPVFTPDAGGLTGTISFPTSPGKSQLRYTIPATDPVLTFTHDGLTPLPVSIHFEMELLAGQFIGGLYVIGDKPAVRIPIGTFRDRSFRDALFSIAGRDGVGLSIRTPGGFTALNDTRNYKGDKFRWGYDLAVKPTDRAFALSFNRFVTEPPPQDIKPDGPPARGSWEPIPELTDEFDGARLDTTKWNDHDLGWEGRVPSWFSPGNVAVKDGRLQLSAKLEEPPREVRSRGFHTYTVAAVTSKRRVLYGYFEAKAKIMDLRICNAFWLYYNDKSDHSQSEIDVFEICGGRNQFERTLFHTIHVFESPKSGGKHWVKNQNLRVPRRLADDFHVFALDWNKDEISCYIDGFLFSCFPNTDWHIPLNLDFDNEINTPWFGNPEKGDFPGVFNVEYIRSWRRTDGVSPTVLLEPSP